MRDKQVLLRMVKVKEYEMYKLNAAAIKPLTKTDPGISQTMNIKDKDCKRHTINDFIYIVPIDITYTNVTDILHASTYFLIDD